MKQKKPDDEEEKPDDKEEKPNDEEEKPDDEEEKLDDEEEKPEKKEQNNENSDSGKFSSKLVALFIILGILLIGGIVLGTFLICRKICKTSDKDVNSERKKFDMELNDIIEDNEM